MTRRERLMATLNGRPVDRPAVCFYEVGGFLVNPDDPDPYNVYNDPSWRPLLRMAEERTDLIRMVAPGLTPAPGSPRADLFHTETWEEGESRFTRTTVHAPGRDLTSLSRRDRGTDTLWSVEHLLKSEEDAEAYLALPGEAFEYVPDTTAIEAAEAAVGDAGIVMVDCGDALCSVASLFGMDDFMVIAYTRPELIEALLDKIAPGIQSVVDAVSAALPGRLWRIPGPEYAAEPYLPNRLFRAFVERYDAPLVRAIQAGGGFCRIHCHGRVKAALPVLAEMGVDAVDPLEPAPHGDVTLAEVRREYGRDMVLFGNLEARDVETMDPVDFQAVVAQALEEGTCGEGRGFVLMPSASPYGRTITPRCMANYETMLRLAGA